jgi:paraquat-inducible protein B
MSDVPPTVQIEPAGKSLLGRVSIVWAIPFLALAMALGVAWQNYNDRGPLIEIEFTNGAGVAPRETELRYRDVVVGLVEDVKFTPDLSAIVASVRVDKEVAPYINATSTFWIVQPELTARGISGLDTVLSGVYIEGSWDGTVGPVQTRFQGLPEAPLFRSDQGGLEITLRTTASGSMTDNSPITFRGIEVGRVGKARISPQGNFAIAEALIFDPHSRMISSATRFWETSGFTFTVGPTGAEIDFSSLATLVGGGLSFDTFVSGGAPVSDGAIFEVYGGSTQARNSLFFDAEVETLEMRVVFDENISGLAVDAPVEIKGLEIGKVQSVLGAIDEAAFGDSRVRLNVVLAIQPARLGLPPGDVTAEAALAFLSSRVEEGLRARLANAGLLSGGLKIELVQVDDALFDQVRTDAGTIPILPTTDSNIADAAATVEGVITRINNLPIEELLASAIGFLDSAETLISSEDVAQTPKDVRLLLDDVRGIVASDAVQNIPEALNATVSRFETLLGQLEDADLANRLVAAVDAATAAAGGVTSSVAGVPDLITQLQAIAAKAEALPLEDLTTQLTELTASADAILDTDAARQLPADLGAALNEINATLGELRAGGAVTNINETLASTRDAADAVATSTQDLPALVEQVRAVIDQASAAIAGYDQGDVLSREAQTALRDISKAADALASLARMLERNPSALIRGR